MTWWYLPTCKIFPYFLKCLHWSKPGKSLLKNANALPWRNDQKMNSCLHNAGALKGQHAMLMRGALVGLAALPCLDRTLHATAGGTVQGAHHSLSQEPDVSMLASGWNILSNPAIHPWPDLGPGPPVYSPIVISQQSLELSLCLALNLGLPAHETCVW